MVEGTVIIYEMHVRGFTQHPSSDVADCRRGTYRGVIDKIPYLQQLGVTAVGLMPIFQYDPGERNYWGYMPLNFFSAHHAYAIESDAHGQQNEFKQMVKALHAAGIEVILDVVYNHTSEGDERAPHTAIAASTMHRITYWARTPARTGMTPGRETY